MLVRTDDEVYRVDAVWLGPPRATFPWRARYVSYGVGLLVMMVIMIVQRQVGIGLNFISVAWSVVGTVAITRLLGKKINEERPLGQVLGQFWAEVTGPRAGRRAAGGSVRAGHVRVRASRAHPGVQQRPWKAAGRPSGGPRPGVRAATGRTSGSPARPGRLVGAGERPAVVTVPAGGSGEPARAEPERVVPPLPEPGSAPKPRRFRRARGRSRGRGASVPARVGRNEAWRREGHRGRS